MNLFSLVFFTMAMRVTILTSDSVKPQLFLRRLARAGEAEKSDRKREKEKTKEGKTSDQKVDVKDW